MKKLIIFICLIFCGFHLSAMGNGASADCLKIKQFVAKNNNNLDEYVDKKYVQCEYETLLTPIEAAIEEPGNVDAVKVLLNKKPSLATTKRYDYEDRNATMLEYNSRSCGKKVNNAKAIAELLIENGAKIDIDKNVTKYKMGHCNSAPCTLLDNVIEMSKNCKDGNNCEACKDLAQFLRDNGAHTYVELKPSASNNVAVAKRTENKQQLVALQQEELVVVDAADVAPKAEPKLEQKTEPKVEQKSEQVKSAETPKKTVDRNEKNKNSKYQKQRTQGSYLSQEPFYDKVNLTPFYLYDGLSDSARESNLREFERWKQECNKLSSYKDRYIKSVSVSSEQQDSKIKYTCVIKDCISNDYKPAPNNGSYCVKKTAEERNAVNALAVAQSSSKTVTVSGTVVDEKNNEPVQAANVSITKDDKCQNQVSVKTGGVLGVSSDENGKFEIKNVPSDAYVCISSVEYPDDKRILPVTDEELKIRLKNGKNLEEVHVNSTRRNPDGTECHELEENIESGIWKSFRGEICPYKEGLFEGVAVEDRSCQLCIPGKCVDGYIISDDGLKCEKCEINMMDNTFGVESVVVDNDKCIVNKCKDGFTRSDDKMQCIINDIPENKCSDEQLANLYAVSGEIEGGECVPTVCADNTHVLKEIDGKNQCVKKQQKEPDSGLQKKLDDAQKAYDDAKAKEQSLANRALTAATTAATGIGGMELARGLTEQSADRDAAAAMADYIRTMQCEYANGKIVKAGRDEIELPGGNDTKFGNYRAEYLAVASDLKARKNALGLKPGIESEEILDKTTLGLYDDENTGITSGSEASRYRAAMLQSEKDQSELDELSADSSRRVKGGAIATGVGVVGGIVGNSLINGELGKKLKEKKIGKETQKLMEKDAATLEELKKCLKAAGVKDVDELEFKEFRVSALSLKNVRCMDLLADSNNTANIKASDLFIDSKDADKVCKNWEDNITNINIGYMIGANNTVNVNGCVYRLDTNIKAIDKKYEEADKKDKADAKKSGLDLKSLGIGDNMSLESILSDINPLKNSKSFGSPDSSSSFNLGGLLQK